MSPNQHGTQNPALRKTTCGPQPPYLASTWNPDAPHLGKSGGNSCFPLCCSAEPHLSPELELASPCAMATADPLSPPLLLSYVEVTSFDTCLPLHLW